MKINILFASLLLASISITSCKKETSELVETKTMSESKTFALSKEDYKKLSQHIREGKDPQPLFLEFQKSYPKSENVKNRNQMMSVNDYNSNSLSYYELDEFMSGRNFNGSATGPVRTFDDDFSPNRPVYTDYVDAYSSFTKRQIALSIHIPYRYSGQWMGLNPYVKAHQYAQPNANIIGSNIGDVDPVVPLISFNQFTSNSATARVSGFFYERRTIIRATDGSIEIKGEVEALAVTVGSTVRAGVSVESKENTVTDYTYDCDVSFNNLSGINSSSGPTIGYSIYGKSVGVQRN
ncbi:hypothetical protein D3C87_1082180 [compost metagenome]